LCVINKVGAAYRFLNCIRENRTGDVVNIQLLTGMLIIFGVVFFQLISVRMV